MRSPGDKYLWSRDDFRGSTTIIAADTAQRKIIAACG